MQHVSCTRAAFNAACMHTAHIVFRCLCMHAARVLLHRCSLLACSLHISCTLATR